MLFIIVKVDILPTGAYWFDFCVAFQPFRREALIANEENLAIIPTDTPRINAVILALVRNEEVHGMVQSMRDLEQTWNHRFQYPWVFFNNVPFSDEFKRLTQNETKAKCQYGMAHGPR